jgi:hypothetical protein
MRLEELLPQIPSLHQGLRLVQLAMGYTRAQESAAKTWFHP